MTKKTPLKTKRLMTELYEEGEKINYVAKIFGVSYSHVWGITRAEERGYDSYRDYQISWVKNLGFGTRKEYEANRARKRQKRPENKRLSGLITAELKKRGLSQSGFARMINVSRESVSKYCQGKYIPNKVILERLFSALSLPRDTTGGLFKHAA